MLCDPVKLVFPDVEVLLPKNHEKREILDHRVWKLHISGSVWAGYPEWKDGTHAIRLGLEWIRVKSRAVVFHSEFMQPCKIVLHEWGTKSSRPPKMNILSNLGRLRVELCLRRIELPIVLQT